MSDTPEAVETLEFEESHANVELEPKKKQKQKKIDSSVFSSDDLEKIFTTSEGKAFLEKKFEENRKSNDEGDRAACVSLFMKPGTFAKKESAEFLMNKVGKNHHRYAKLFNDHVINMTDAMIWDVIGKSNVDNGM